MTTFRRSVLLIAAIVLIAIGATLTDAQSTFLRATRFVLDDGASPSAGQCEISSGSGTPESNVTGDVCDIYLRTDGSTGAVLYVKATGSGNTGWETAGSGGAAAAGSSGGGGAATVVRKADDESVTSSTTLQDDDDLVLSVGANETWVIEYVLFVDGSTGGDFSWAFSVPTGATGIMGGFRLQSLTSGATDDIGTSATTTLTSGRLAGLAGAGSPVTIVSEATITTSSTAGSIALQWAQGTSSATATKLLAGSTLVARKAAPLASATMYVATTGSDSTGDGSSGTPFATVGHALSLLPNVADQSYTINVADGTYAEDLTIPATLSGGQRSISIVGDTTTPANVVFTGTETHDDAGISITSVGYVDGPVRLTLSGITIDATADRGIWAGHGAQLVLDRSVVTGTLSIGVHTAWRAFLELKGNITISGWADRGIEMTAGSNGTYSSAGTLTITGPATAGAWGFHIYGQSAFYVLTRVGAASNTNITITGVEIGFQLGFNSSFSHQMSGSTITVDNVTTPASSAGVQCTDNSNWSTTQAVVLDHLSIGWWVNSISYAEATGTRTITNVGSNSVAVQNGVVSLP